MREAVQQRRAAYAEAKTAIEGWKREALGVYGELLHVLRPPAAAEGQMGPSGEVDAAEAETTAEAMLAADIGGNVSNSSNSRSAAAAYKLSPLPPLPETIGDLEALEARLRLQIDRSSRVGSSALADIARNIMEVRSVTEDMRKTQQEAQALHHSIHREAER